MKPLALIVAAAVLILGAKPSAAQPVISAKSGVISTTMGKVSLDGQTLDPTVAQFPDIKENAVVRTDEGRVEVLLTPGIFLRIGENGSFRMISRRLIDTRLELLGGSALVEAAEIVKDNNVTVIAGDASVTFPKAGLFRFDTQPARIRVIKGTASVATGGQTVLVSAGRMLDLAAGASAEPEKFDTADADSLDNWSERRSQYVAMANISAAKYVRDNSLSLGSGAWGWNPYFGMYTYLPLSNRVWSPYGFRFWSPGTVAQVYYQPPSNVWNNSASSGGFAPSYRTMAPVGGGYSGTMSSAPAVHSAPASSTAAAPAAGATSVGHGGGAASGSRGR